jgi:hypothetical protein
MKFLRRLFYRLFPRYHRLELRCVPYKEADQLLRENEGKRLSDQWRIAPEEDFNRIYCSVWLERRARIIDQS